MFLDKTLYAFHTGVEMVTGEFIAGGNPQVSRLTVAN